MYPKPFWKSKTFWLATAQYLLNAGQMISFILTGNLFGLNAQQTVVLVVAENGMLGVAHLILRFYTNQPIVPSLTK